MSEAFWLLLAAALSFSGMAWLALAMEVHWGQVMHQDARAVGPRRRLLRTLGAVALLMSLQACLVADRPSMAVLVWVMLLAGSAFGVAMLLSRRAHWLAPWAGRRSAHRP
ncbi:MAG: DUF3325 domain-containing protein [Hydrogenophaga sp.]|jgi:hypothetical protein|nr:DUF3325 domain-containing protein [Hydrogenophaga sp.]